MTEKRLSSCMERKSMNDALWHCWKPRWTVLWALCLFGCGHLDDVSAAWSTASPRWTTLWDRGGNGRRSSRSSRISSVRRRRSSSSALESEQQAVQLKYCEYLPKDDGEFEEEGHGKDPVILLHGLLGNKRNFASIAAALSSQLCSPRRIYAVDLRNHGENGHDWRRSMTYSDMARDVLAFLEEVVVAGQGGRRVVLVGHSMGGKVAQALALMHPDRVAGLVVLDIAPVRYTPENDVSWDAVSRIVHHLASLDLSPRHLNNNDHSNDHNNDHHADNHSHDNKLKTKRDVDLALRPVLEDPALRAFILTNLEQTRPSKHNPDPIESPSLRWKINIGAIHDQLDIIAGFDVHDRDLGSALSRLSTRDTSTNSQHLTTIQQYEGDVFYIHGGASRFVRHSHMKAISALFPNHMLTTIRGAGHWVHAEAPDDTVALLKRYLDR